MEKISIDEVVHDLEKHSDVTITQLQKWDNRKIPLSKNQFINLLDKLHIRYIDMAEGFILKGRNYYIDYQDRIIDIQLKR